MKDRKTRIVVTLGLLPESTKKKENFIHDLINAGADVFRLNMSHIKIGEEDELLQLVDIIRKTSTKLSKPVAIMTDLQGPKIRLCEVPEHLTTVNRGDRLKIGDASNSDIQVRNCSGFTEAIGKAIEDRKSVTINIGDGSLVLRAVNTVGSSILFKAENDGKIRTGQGVTVRGVRLPAGSYKISNYPHDMWSAKVMAEYSDLIALSFVNSNKDIENLQHFISDEVMKPDVIAERYGGVREYPIVAKIETDEGVLNIENIVDRAFGIMVARGDMGVQLGLEYVPLAQKEIIRKCNIWGKPVIVATQMLASMVNSTEPTRAEVSDVANAIIDGADALMLSDETAIGKYPIESVKTIDTICKTVEKKTYYKINKPDFERGTHNTVDNLYKDFEHAIEEKKKTASKKTILSIDETAHFVSYTSVQATYLLDCDAILAISKSGATARRLARFKPKVPVIVGTYTDRVRNLCSLSPGITPLLLTQRRDIADRIRCLEEEFPELEREAYKKKILKKGMRVVRIAGLGGEKFGETNLLHIVEI